MHKICIPGWCMPWSGKFRVPSLNFRFAAGIHILSLLLAGKHKTQIAPAVSLSHVEAVKISGIVPLFDHISPFLKKPLFSASSIYSEIGFTLN